jgi:phosphoribosylaminoimidazole-succinocarboxamide synthase
MDASLLLDAGRRSYLGARARAPLGHRLAGCRYLASGKVRDLYALDARHLLFVTSDRISAFDVVMGSGVPDKGRILTHIAAWWFEQTRGLIDNHLVSTSVDDLPRASPAERDLLRGRIMIVRRTAPTPVEWVVRGYLAGSGYKAYRETGRLFETPLPAGMVSGSQLPEPLLTPTTKAEGHDLPLTLAEARALVGAEVFERARRAALELFAGASLELEKRGILLADTKFEFGLLEGRLLLIDEALTPDSSRFWPLAGHTPGKPQESWDKQILRDHLETLDWNKEPPPPALPGALLERLRGRYLELCLALTGAAPQGLEGPA